MGQEQGAYIDGESGSDFVYGYGGGGDEFAIDYASYYAPIDYAPGFEEIPYAPYEQSWEIESPVPFADIISTSEPGEIPFAPYEQSWELEPFIPFADILDTSAQAPIDYAPYQQYWPIEPFTPEPLPLPPVFTPVFPLVAPPVPQVTQTPTVSPGPIPMAPGLPPACPTGQYHPYPIGHPQQNACVPFPPAQTGSKPQQQQKPTASSGGAASGGAQQKPQQQQQCPQGQYRDPVTGQCKPIPSGQPQQCPTGYYRASNGQCLPIPKCTTPGTVFDAARGLCVPQGQAISPLPSGEFDELLGDLKNIPWWVWLALGGLILLSRDEDGKKTTVTYRRAR